jgi:acyl carrier protein
MSIDQKQFLADFYKLLAKLAETEPDKIQPSDHLRDDLGLDSLKSMELLSRISEKYELDVELEDLVEMGRVEDVVDFLEKYLRPESVS